MALASNINIKNEIIAFALENTGEAMMFWTKDGVVSNWRCAPMDARGDAAQEYARQLLPARENQPIKIITDDVLFMLDNGIEIEGCYCVAAAAAMLDANKSINLARDALDAPSNLLAKLRAPLTKLTLSAAIFFLGLGFYFDHRIAQNENRRAQCVEVEDKLWKKYAPECEYHPGKLKEEFQRKIAERAKIQSSHFASALSFWTEVSCALPNANSIGLEIESLQLSPEGGRLVARVNPGATDPLANAALLDRSLNKSSSLTARGEFENKNTDVIVRMRLDYQPLKIKR